ADAIHLDDDSPLPIQVYQRGRLVLVDLEAVPNRLLGVVRASPSEDPLGQLVLVYTEDDHLVETVLSDELVERLDLGGSARKAIQNEALSGIFLCDALFQHLHGDGVGDVVARIHDRLDPLTDLGAFADVQTEHVPGPDEGHSEPLGDPGGLGSLSRPRRPNEQQSHADRSWGVLPPCPPRLQTMRPSSVGAIRHTPARDTPL